MQNNLYQNYLELTEHFIISSRKYLYSPSDRPDLLCYGTGVNGWGVQTHQKAFAAYAVLAADPNLNEQKIGMSKKELLDHSLKMLRFTLESHIEGSYRCTDGNKWGHTWISALGLERMMHGVEAIYDDLSDADKQLIRRVLISESNWLLEHYTIKAGPIQDNKPESNIWNGSMLLRTAAMYEDCEKAEEYINKGLIFLINGISVPNDRASRKIVDGKSVDALYVGNNFFDTYSLNHHGYLNVGYMVICLSNLAMLHFSFKKMGKKAPDALYHNAKELWELIKACTFSDGRLLRIGGDTRVRYCYCQDYAVPMWIFVRDYLKDTDCEKYEAAWLKTVEQEVKSNGDHSYLSDRCRDLIDVSPLYYTRLESDRAATLSMGAYYHRLFEYKGESAGIEKISAWQDAYHGACLIKGEKRIASWVWRGAEGAVGLCLLPDASDMAEWKHNLTGQIKGLGCFHKYEVFYHNQRQFAGGFVTSGAMAIYSEHFASEQQTVEHIATEKIAFAALPDDSTTVVMQYAYTRNRTYFSQTKGLTLNIPNDIFNGSKRSYYYNQACMEHQGLTGSEEIIKADTNWINVDDRLGLIHAYGGDGLMLYRPGERQIGIKWHPGQDASHQMGMLCADEICIDFKKGTYSVDADSTIFDIGAVIKTNIDHKKTEEYAGKKGNIKIQCGSDMRHITVFGEDGYEYVVIANFGDAKARLGMNMPLLDVAQNREVSHEIYIEAGGARVLRALFI